MVLVVHPKRCLSGQLRGKHSLGLALLCGRSGLGEQVRAQTSTAIRLLLPLTHPTRAHVCLSHSSRIEYEYAAKVTKSKISTAVESATVSDRELYIYSCCWGRLSHPIHV